MNPDEIFGLANLLAMICWIILVIFPFEKWASNGVFGIAISILAIFYAYMVFSSINPSDFESFSTLEGVMTLFTAKEAVLAGWIHYLAFDLMVGLYIVNNAKQHEVNRWLLIPSLFFTFMLGPVGLLIYKILKFARTKKVMAYS